MSFRHDLSAVRLSIDGPPPIELQPAVDAVDPHERLATRETPAAAMRLAVAHKRLCERALPCKLSWVARGVRVADVAGYLAPEAGNLARIYTCRPGIFYRVQLQPADVAQIRTMMLERQTPPRADVSKRTLT